MTGDTIVHGFGFFDSTTMAEEKKRTDRMAEDVNERMAMNDVRMYNDTPRGQRVEGY